MAGEEDAEAEEVLAEFDFLVSETGEGAGEATSHADATEWGMYGILLFHKITQSHRHSTRNAV